MEMVSAPFTTCLFLGSGKSFQTIDQTFSKLLLLFTFWNIFSIDVQYYNRHLLTIQSSLIQTLWKALSDWSSEWNDLRTKIIILINIFHQHINFPTQRFPKVTTEPNIAFSELGQKLELLNSSAASSSSSSVSQWGECLFNIVLSLPSLYVRMTWFLFTYYICLKVFLAGIV